MNISFNSIWRNIDLLFGKRRLPLSVLQFPVPAINKNQPKKRRTSIPVISSNNCISLYSHANNSGQESSDEKENKTVTKQETK